MLSTHEEIKKAIGHKKNMRIFATSNGTGIIASLNAATDGQIKGVLGFGRRFPRSFKLPQGMPSELQRIAGANIHKNPMLSFL